MIKLKTFDFWNLQIYSLSSGIPEKIKNVTVFYNGNAPNMFNNLSFDVENLIIHTKIPIKLLNLPATLKTLTLKTNDNSWIKKYINNGDIKIPFECKFNFV